MVIFFYAFHQTAGRAEAGLLAPRAPCRRLTLKGNLPSSFSPPPSINPSQEEGCNTLNPPPPDTDRLAALHPLLVSLPPSPLLPPLGSGPQEDFFLDVPTLL